jgi:hypothetical protein
MLDGNEINCSVWNHHPARAGFSGFLLLSDHAKFGVSAGYRDAKRGAVN